MWRYQELLPLADPGQRVSLEETMTPLVECPRLAERLGLETLLIKDESRLPTGSFKARGMAVAVSMARELGIERVAAPTAGNAGGALAAYAARAGMECFVFMPVDAPLVNRCEAALYGARAYVVDGLINDCAAIVRDGRDAMGWFDMSTLKEPYRIEGKKTMGLELADQLDWQLPDVILYPTVAALGSSACGRPSVSWGRSAGSTRRASPGSTPASRTVAHPSPTPGPGASASLSRRPTRAPSPAASAFPLRSATS